MKLVGENEPACIRCKYWEAKEPGEFLEEGLCRRSAPRPMAPDPQLLLINLMHAIRPLPGERDADDPGDLTLQKLFFATLMENAMWPETEGYDWCGEYVVKEAGNERS